jgi:hypothetical protein
MFSGAIKLIPLNDTSMVRVFSDGAFFNKTVAWQRSSFLASVLASSVLLFALISIKKYSIKFSFASSAARNYRLQDTRIAELEHR